MSRKMFYVLCSVSSYMHVDYRRVFHRACEGGIIVGLPTAWIVY
jgi:hypothetical protein